MHLWSVACIVTAVLHSQESVTGIVDLFDRKQHREVISHYEGRVAGREFPDSVLVCVAKSYYILGNNTAALDLYRHLRLRSYFSSTFALDYAMALTEVGSYDSAETLVDEGLAAALQSEDTLLIARLTNVRGINKMRQSLYPAALDDFHIAERLAGTHAGLRAFIRANQGIVFRRIGHYQAALRCYRESFTLDSAEGRLHDMASGWLNIGNIYYDLGQFDDAESHFMCAGDAYTTVGDSAGLMLAVGNRAAVYQQTGRYLRARPLLEMAATYAKHQQDRLLYLSLMQELAFGDMQLSQWAEADRALFSLWNEALELKSVLDQFTILMLRAFVKKHQRLLSESSEFLMRAGELCRSNGMEMEWMVLSEQASLLELLEQPVEAEILYRRAIRQLEMMRENNFPSHLLTSFFDGRRLEVYRRLIDLLIRQERYGDAFDVMEAHRGRTFNRPDGKQKQSTNVTRISYFVSDTSIYAFIGHDSVRSIRLPYSEAFRHDVLLYSSHIRNRHADPGTLLSDKIFKVLVEPLLSWVPEGQPVAVIPDGFLHGLVFESLTDSGRYWIERNPIVYAPAAFLVSGKGRTFHPSVDTVRLLCRSLYENGMNVYNLGNLPQLEFEKKLIRQTWPLNESVDSAITESRVKDAIENTNGLLHIGAHGIAADRQQTALVFEKTDRDDGLLHVDEVRQLQVRPAFVVLSACATAAGGLTGSDGVSNLPMAFLSSGAAQVLSSQWAVNDEAAAEFMGAFYKFLSTNQTVPQALQSVKIGFLKHPRYRSPYYWAGTMLWVAN